MNVDLLDFHPIRWKSNSITWEFFMWRIILLTSFLFYLPIIFSIFFCFLKNLSTATYYYYYHLIINAIYSFGLKFSSLNVILLTNIPFRISHNDSFILYTLNQASPTFRFIQTYNFQSHPNQTLMTHLYIAVSIIRH